MLPKIKKPARVYEYISLVFLCASAVLLIAVDNLPFGATVFATGLASLLFAPPDFRKHVLLIYWAVGLLSIAPINTSTEPLHILLLGLPMALALLTPIIVGKYVYKDNLVRIPFNFRRRWTRLEIFYYLLIIFIAYLFIPIILQTGSSYLNWEISPNTRSLVESFIGLNSVAIWEEIFFVSVVFGILRRHFTVLQANLAQAVLFTSFLYDMGFVGWCPLFIYIFALSQGFLYVRTNSLAYLLAIHLSIDVILHLALVNLHNPGLAPIFITG